MTNEMKENIIKYLTGNLDNEQPSHDLVYSDIETNTNNLSSQLDTKYGSEKWAIQNIIQGQNNELSLIYGEYIKNSKTKGFIVIIDQLGNPIQIIDKYSSNVDIGYIYCMNVDEEGKFYMIEINTSNNAKRFVILNNILVKLATAENYSVHIRRAYNIPDSSPAYSVTDNDGSISKIIKAYGQGKYMFGGVLNSSNGIGVYITELIIQVGATNEWNSYIGSSGGQAISEDIDLYATWSDDTFSLVLLAYPVTYNGIIYKFRKASVYLPFNTISIDFTGYSKLWGQNAKILNNTKAYFTLSGVKSGQYTYDNAIYEIDLTNRTSNQIFIQSGDYDIDYEKDAKITLVSINNEIMFLNSLVTTNVSKFVCTYYIGRIREDSDYYTNKISSKEIISIEKSYQDVFANPVFYINKLYNLYNFNVIIESNRYTTYQVYNILNYNGTSFNSLKSLLPNSSILYDENDNIIFARNLYNKVISGGTTTSSMEVPNNYLNDVTISTKNLLSFNNNVLVTDTEDITKNQYETLDINFINTLSIINENNINDPIENDNGASRLNNSISNDLDYTNMYITKVRYNYSDNTTFIKEISLPTQISQFVYQYVFNVYIPNSKSITSIDMLSNDGNTIFQTINTSNLIRGKAYKISQNVEIQ